MTSKRRTSRLVPVGVPARLPAPPGRRDREVRASSRPARLGTARQGPQPTSTALRLAPSRRGRSRRAVRSTYRRACLPARAARGSYEDWSVAFEAHVRRQPPVFVAVRETPKELAAFG